MACFVKSEDNSTFESFGVLPRYIYSPYGVEVEVELQ